MLDELKKLIKGDVENNSQVKDTYSHDTSLFEVKPQAVIFPKDTQDLKKLVKYVNFHKRTSPHLSLTARAAGTDMSGGAVNDSLIVVFERYMNEIGNVKGNKITSEPGAYYRDFEKKTLKHGKIFPSYPASKNLCAVGGIVANNAGGEKSLIYGKTEHYVPRIKAVLSDGNEYEFKPLKGVALKKKLTQKGYEGDLYRRVFKLIDKNYAKIQKSRPPVSKNSTGYNIWDVWDKKNKIFDMNKLFIGSQGTLGLMTEHDIKLVDEKPYSGLLVGYVPSLDNLGDLIKTVVEHKPSSFETFDDHTIKFAMKFFLQFRKTLGWARFIKLGLSFIPDVFLMTRGFVTNRGLPKLIILIEYEGKTEAEVKKKLDILRDDLDKKGFNIELEEAETAAKSERFWIMRRESFALLRNNVKGNVHTAPFIDDLVVPPKHLPQFFPEFKEILERNNLLYTIAGHMGDGNFHVIPLMDFSDKKEIEKIEPVLRECVKLVKKYEGSMSGEHNDGLIRGPFLKDMYGKEIYDIFKEIKHIFDPDNIFNPHKKTDANWRYTKSRMRSHF